MDSYITGVNPVNMIASGVVANKRITTKEDANKAFVSLFLNQMLKNVISGNKTLYGTSSSGFTNDLYNDVLIKKISDDLSKDDIFGFGDITSVSSQVKNFNRTGGYNIQ